MAALSGSVVMRRRKPYGNGLTLKKSGVLERIRISTEDLSQSASLMDTTSTQDLYLKAGHWPIDAIPKSTSRKKTKPKPPKGACG